MAVLPSSISGLQLWTRGDTSVLTGGARRLASASSQDFSAASFAGVNLGTGDFSFDGTLWRTTNGNQVICAKYQDASNYWRLEFTAANVLHFIAVIGGSTLIEVTGTTAVTTTGWNTYALAVDRDSAANTKIYLNGVNDTSGTPTVSASTIDNTGSYFIGQSGAATLFWNGLLARIRTHKGDLVTATEVTWLHNRKNSRVHGELGVAGNDGASLAPTGSYNLNEASGNAIAQAGSNLTAANAPTAADGPATDIAEDSSTNANHALLTNMTSSTAWKTDVVSGATGLSLQLDGVNDHGALGNPASLNITGTGLSITAWVKRNVTTQYFVPLTRRSGVMIQYQLTWVKSNEGVHSNKIRLDVRMGGATVAFNSSTAHADTGWHHIGVAYDGANVTLYFDGVADGSTAETRAIETQAVSNFIGQDNDLPVYSSGSLDDMRIYDDGLTASEFTFLYNDFRGVAGGTDPGTANLKGHWKFDDGPQEPVSDQDPVIEWTSKEGDRRQFQQATVAKRPLARLLTNGINSKTALSFDGTDDLLVLASTPFSADTAGTLVIPFRTPSSFPVADQVLFASSDEAAALNYLMVGIDSAKKCYIEVQAGGATHRVTGDTILVASTNYVLKVSSNGSAWSLKINNTDQTLTVTGSNSGKWFSSLVGADNMTIGALKHTSETKFFKGLIGEYVLYNSDLSDVNDNDVFDYVNDRYDLGLAWSSYSIHIDQTPPRRLRSAVYF